MDNQIQCAIFRGTARQDVMNQCNKFLREKEFVQATQSEYAAYDLNPNWELTITIWYREKK